MKLSKTFGGLTVSATPAPLPGVTFVLDGPPGEFLDMRQVRELYELLGDVLGETRTYLGVDEGDVLNAWQQLKDERLTDTDLSRDEAVLLFWRALDTFDYDNSDALAYINQMVREHLCETAGDADAVVKVGEASPQEEYG